MNDYADFLIGDDKKNSQHIVITYWTTDRAKRRSFRKKKSPRGSLSDLHGDRSNASTPLSMSSSHDMWSEDYGYASLSSLQHNRPDSRGSASSAREVRKSSITKKKKKGVKTLHTIQSESEDMILKSLKEELEEDILEDLENQSELGESVSVPHYLDPRTSRSMTKSARSNNNSTARSSRPESPMHNRKAFEKTVKSLRPDVVERNSLPRKAGMSPDSPNSDDSDQTSFCFKCCSFLTFGKSKVSPFCGSGKVSSPEDENRLFSSSTNRTNKQIMSDVHIEVTSVTTVSNEVGVLTKDHRQRHSSISSSITTLRGPDRSGTPAQDDIERRRYYTM